MISKNKIKFLQSLSRKKARDESGLFIAEGEKLISELINSGFKFELLVARNDRIDKYTNIKCEKIIVSDDELKKISLLSTPSSVIAVCVQRFNLLNDVLQKDDLTLVLDDIQDPGNFGTIIRLASWFGIDEIICSENTVECYNPKVIQATMGAIAHVNIKYTNLKHFLENSSKKGRIVYGTFMEGENIYKTNLVENGIIVFGNEGKGISQEIKEIIAHKISIPSFQANHPTVESLNVSIAASIVCSEFRRRKKQ
jgi:RNA methyltransferase, TrmH family